MVAVCGIRFGGAPLVAQQRDLPAQQAQPRRIPIGTASISGAVISAETGRPLRNVLVSLNGTAGSAEPDGGRAVGSSPVVAGARGSGAAGSGSGRGTAAAGGARAEAAGAPQTLSISRTATTNEQGQFVFARLAAGRYTLNVARDTYLQWTTGQKLPGGRGKPLDLADGEQASLAITLVRGGVMAGRVFGEDGEPVRNVSVGVWRFMTSNGVRRLQQFNNVQTDDRGMYRVINLQPGDYLVSVTPRQSGPIVNEQVAADRALIERAIASAPLDPPTRPGVPAFITLPPAPVPAATRIVVPGFLPVFFPGTVNVRAATPIHVSGGDIHEPLDLSLQFVPATVIQGTVTGNRPAGTQLMVSLANLDPTAPMNTSTTNVSGDEGRFVMQNVLPGRYRLLAQVNQVNAGLVVRDNEAVVPARPPAAGLWAAQELVVDGQPTLDIHLALQPARTISGRVTFDTSQPPQGNPFTVTLNHWVGYTAAQVGSMPSSPVDADGRFTLKNVVPGMFVLRGSAVIRSAILDGRDLLDWPLDFRGDRDISGIAITVSDRRTDLQGTVTDAAGRPLAEQVVVVAPDDSSYWIPGARRIALARTGPLGRYRFQQLPPGRYVVGVVPDLDDGMQYDEEFLKSLSISGRVVNLADDTSVRQDFRAAAP